MLGGGAVSRGAAYLAAFLIAAALVQAGPVHREWHSRSTNGVVNSTNQNSPGGDFGECITDQGVYHAAESVPSPGPCEVCTCRPPTVFCSMMPCPINPGCRTIQRSNQCCPDYRCECEHNGQTFNNGERITIPEQPCQVCYCKGGEVMCTSITCYQRDDCEPNYTDGQCCPKYDHCPPLDGTNGSQKEKLGGSIKVSRNSNVGFKREMQPWLLTQSVFKDQGTSTTSSSVYQTEHSTRTKDSNTSTAQGDHTRSTHRSTANPDQERVVFTNLSQSTSQENSTTAVKLDSKSNSFTTTITQETTTFANEEQTKDVNESTLFDFTAGDVLNEVSTLYNIVAQDNPNLLSTIRLPDLTKTDDTTDDQSQKMTTFSFVTSDNDDKKNGQIILAEYTDDSTTSYPATDVDVETSTTDEHDSSRYTQNSIRYNNEHIRVLNPLKTTMTSENTDHKADDFQTYSESSSTTFNPSMFHEADRGSTGDDTDSTKDKNLVFTTESSSAYDDTTDNLFDSPIVHELLKGKESKTSTEETIYQPNKVILFEAEESSSANDEKPATESSRETYMHDEENTYKDTFTDKTGNDITETKYGTIASILIPAKDVESLKAESLIKENEKANYQDKSQNKNVLIFTDRKPLIIVEPVTTDELDEYRSKNSEDTSSETGDEPSDSASKGNQKNAVVSTSKCDPKNKSTISGETTKHSGGNKHPHTSANINTEKTEPLVIKSEEDDDKGDNEGTNRKTSVKNNKGISNKKHNKEDDEDDNNDESSSSSEENSEEDEESQNSNDEQKNNQHKYEESGKDKINSSPKSRNPILDDDSSSSSSSSSNEETSNNNKPHTSDSSSSESSNSKLKNKDSSESSDSSDSSDSNDRHKLKGSESSSSSESSDTSESKSKGKISDSSSSESSDSSDSKSKDKKSDSSSSESSDSSDSKSKDKKSDSSSSESSDSSESKSKNKKSDSSSSESSDSSDSKSKDKKSDSSSSESSDSSESKSKNKKLDSSNSDLSESSDSKSKDKKSDSSSSESSESSDSKYKDKKSDSSSSDSSELSDSKDKDKKSDSSSSESSESSDSKSKDKKSDSSGSDSSESSDGKSKDKKSDSSSSQSSESSDSKFKDKKSDSSSSESSESSDSKSKEKKFDSSSSESSDSSESVSNTKSKASNSLKSSSKVEKSDSSSSSNSDSSNDSSSSSSESKSELNKNRDSSSSESVSNTKSKASNSLKSSSKVEKSDSSSSSNSDSSNDSSSSSSESKSELNKNRDSSSSESDKTKSKAHYKSDSLKSKASSSSSILNKKPTDTSIPESSGKSELSSELNSSNSDDTSDKEIIMGEEKANNMKKGQYENKIGKETVNKLTKQSVNIDSTWQATTSGPEFMTTSRDFTTKSTDNKPIPELPTVLKINNTIPLIKIRNSNSEGSSDSGIGTIQLHLFNLKDDKDVKDGSINVKSKPAIKLTVQDRNNSSDGNTQQIMLTPADLKLLAEYLINEEIKPVLHSSKEPKISKTDYSSKHLSSESHTKVNTLPLNNIEWLEETTASTYDKTSTESLSSAEPTSTEGSASNDIEENLTMRGTVKDATLADVEVFKPVTVNKEVEKAKVEKLTGDESKIVIRVLKATDIQENNEDCDEESQTESLTTENNLLDSTDRFDSTINSHETNPCDNYEEESTTISTDQLDKLLTTLSEDELVTIIREITTRSTLFDANTAEPTEQPNVTSFDENKDDCKNSESKDDAQINKTSTATQTDQAVKAKDLHIKEASTLRKSDERSDNSRQEIDREPNENSSRKVQIPVSKPVQELFSTTLDDKDLKKLQDLLKMFAP